MVTPVKLGYSSSATVLFFLITMACGQAFLAVDRTDGTTAPASASRLMGSCPAEFIVHLPGFVPAKYFNEQIREYHFDPEVRIHINAPGSSLFDRRKSTALILYALPNGNTTAQTIGRRMVPGVDWHYDIQHIGAQVRRLREVVQDENIVVAYLEAEGRSWPAWKIRHADYGRLIPRIIASIREQLPVADVKVTLSAHSGGGGFIFGYMEGVERIGDDVVRIAFLDANYGFVNDEKQGTMLVEWLKRDQGHFLEVLAYDDRDVKLDGKNIVGPDGGTWRKTMRMVACLRKNIEFKEVRTADYIRYRGLNRRIDIILHENPKLKILHTALVGEMNGFIHVMTSGTDYENKAAVFKGPITYKPWIQPD